MKINNRTRFRDVAPLLHDEGYKMRIMEAVDDVPLLRPIIGCTCGEFMRLSDGDVDTVLKFTGKSRKALKMLGRLKRFTAEMKGIEVFFERNKVEPTDDDTRAMAGVTFPTFNERMLLEVQQRFGLKSFAEAENVPFSSYMLIFKESSANLKFQYNRSRIIEAKQKTIK